MKTLIALVALVGLAALPALGQGLKYNRFDTNTDAATINGNTLTNLNATELRSGTVADGRLSTNIPVESGTNLTWPTVLSNDGKPIAGIPPVVGIYNTNSLSATLSSVPFFTNNGTAGLYGFSGTVVLINGTSVQTLSVKLGYTDTNGQAFNANAASAGGTICSNIASAVTPTTLPIPETYIWLPANGVVTFGATRGSTGTCWWTWIARKYQ